VGDSLVVADNTLYVATYQGMISAVNLRTGQTIWEQKVSSYAGLATDSRHVYVTDSDSHLWAFDRRTGELAWKQDKLFGRGLTGPAVVGNALVVADNKGYIHWLSTEDGHFVARERAAKVGILAPPVVSGRDVYIYTNAGVLVKYRV
jgi:outer membrane protein assembly factor BamB